MDHGNRFSQKFPTQNYNDFIVIVNSPGTGTRGKRNQYSDYCGNKIHLKQPGKLNGY